MRAHRITSTGEAAPGGRVAAPRLPGPRSAGRAGEGIARRTRCCLVAVLALGVAGTAPRRAVADPLASAPGPAAIGTSGQGDATPAGAAGPAAAGSAGGAPGVPDAATPPADAGVPRGAVGPLGRANGMLPAQHPRRGGRHAPEPMPGCTSTATLDGVSAALQAGPFGRRKGLAIMQFRNVVTDGAEDGRVSCHSDVLLSDGSLHRTQYGLDRGRRGTRLHIEVAAEREDAAPAPGDTPAQAPPAPVAPDAGAPGTVPPSSEAPGARGPAT